MDQFISCPLCNGHGAIPNSVPEPCLRCRGKGAISTAFAPHTQPTLGHMPWENRCPECDGSGLQRRAGVTRCAMCAGRGSLPRSAITVLTVPGQRSRW